MLFNFLFRDTEQASEDNADFDAKPVKVVNESDSRSPPTVGLDQVEALGPVSPRQPLTVLSEEDRQRDQFARLQEVQRRQAEHMQQWMSDLRGQGLTRAEQFSRIIHASDTYVHLYS